MKIWRHGYVWLAILAVCLVALLTQATIFSRGKMPQRKAHDVLTSPLVATVPAIPRQTDWTDIGLKVGSGLGGLMTLTNLIEKAVNIFKRRNA